MSRSLPPTQVRELTLGRSEYALLDVREEGAFSRKRLMLASCLPLSHLELRATRLVPRLTTPIVLVDDGEQLAKEGWRRLTELGYSNLFIMEGGIAAWEAQGFPVYSGVNVLTKAFGEVVHERCGTPDISAEELDGWVREGRNVVIVDARPFHEYVDHTIPGSISVPGAELVARAAAVAPDPRTVVVVNCAGRTRSIIGCQSLINSGITNKVYALRNGTMGWKLAGLQVERGASRRAGLPDADVALDKARDLAERFGVRTIDRATLANLAAEGTRNVYLFDVRTPDAYARGHASGTRNAPGGQLVQAFDDYVGVRGAIIALTDPLHVRAVMTASWLNQIGQSETYLLSDPGPATETASATHENLSPTALRLMSVSDLIEHLAASDPAILLDLSTSVEHRAEHIPGSYWTVRGRYRGLRDAAAVAGTIVVYGSDPALLRLAAPEIEEVIGRRVLVLEGGLAAWRDAGHPIERGIPRPLSDVDDVWYKPFELSDPEAERQAALSYLDWEVELTRKVAQDTVRFDPMVVPR